MKICCARMESYVVGGIIPDYPIVFFEGRWVIEMGRGADGEPRDAIGGIRFCPFCSAELPKDGKWPEA